MKIIAEFSIDPDDGQPASVWSNGVRHYSISLKVKDVPQGVRRLRYRLHPSFREQVRNVSFRIPDFEEPITSYGDFDVTVEYEELGEHKTLTRNLSDALREGHRGKTPAIEAALKDIAAH